MKTAHDHIDDLIASYLAGEATANEVAFVEDWKNKSEENRRYFEQIKIIFQQAPFALPSEQFDTDRAWQKVRQQLPSKGKSVSLKNQGFSGYSFLKIAAGIIVLLAAGIFTYQVLTSSSNHSKELLSYTTTSADTLPDGSGVYLNRQTRIEYTFDKNENIRRAKLTGEAYFNIRHDDESTFIVEVDGTLIKDIGTSFNVKAYPGSRTIEVVVAEGEVMFYTAGNPGINLKAGKKGIFNKDTGIFFLSEPEPNVTAYKTKIFNFTNHSLEVVIETLNDVYATRIAIDEHLKNCRLTVSFNNEDIDEIAQVIAETLGLKASRDNNVITLKGAGCTGGKR